MVLLDGWLGGEYETHRDRQDGICLGVVVDGMDRDSNAGGGVNELTIADVDGHVCD